MLSVWKSITASALQVSCSFSSIGVLKTTQASHTTTPHGSTAQSKQAGKQGGREGFALSSWRWTKVAEVPGAQ